MHTAHVRYWQRLFFQEVHGIRHPFRYLVIVLDDSTALGHHPILVLWERCI